MMGRRLSLPSSSSNARGIFWCRAALFLSVSSSSSSFILSPISTSPFSRQKTDYPNTKTNKVVVCDDVCHSKKSSYSSYSSSYSSSSSSSYMSQRDSGNENDSDKKRVYPPAVEYDYGEDDGFVNPPVDYFSPEFDEIEEFEDPYKNEYSTPTQQVPMGLPFQEEEEEVNYENRNNNNSPKTTNAADAAASFDENSVISSLTDIVENLGQDLYEESNKAVEFNSTRQFVTPSLTDLKDSMDHLEQELYKENKGVEFNINSPRQVAALLFGKTGGSTNKDVLEAMASAGNRIADLVLQYRKCQRDYKRYSKRQERQEQEEQEANDPNSKIIQPSRDPLLLVDASAYIYRAYYSMPPRHRSDDGTPTGAVLGFFNMVHRLILNRILSGECPRLVLVFDAKGPTFRHQLYSEYKANRPECPFDLIPQFDLIKEAAMEAYGIDCIEAPSYEADDVIATLSKMGVEQGLDVQIYSGDKDLMQLVTEPNVKPIIHMIDPMTLNRVHHDIVVSKWGVPPRLVGDVLALAGDSADNIPGVPSIGPKIAASLIQEFGTLENLLDRMDEIKQKGRREKLKEHVDVAKLSRQLVELECGIPLDKISPSFDNIDSLRMNVVNIPALMNFFDKMEFVDMKRRVKDRISKMKYNVNNRDVLWG